MVYKSDDSESCINLNFIYVSSGRIFRILRMHVQHMSFFVLSRHWI